MTIPNIRSLDCGTYVYFQKVYIYINHVDPVFFFEKHFQSNSKTYQPIKHHHGKLKNAKGNESSISCLNPMIAEKVSHEKLNTERREKGTKNLPSLKLTANAPENRPKPNRKVIFQPSILRGGNVSFREGKKTSCLEFHLDFSKGVDDIFP